MDELPADLVMSGPSVEPKDRGPGGGGGTADGSWRWLPAPATRTSSWALAPAQQGPYEEALAALGQGDPLGTQPGAHGIRGHIYVGLGEHDRALDLLEQAARRRIGLVRPLVVSEERSDAGPPSPDIRIRPSNCEVPVEGDVSPGRRAVEVPVVENPEVGFGHRVHLTRLDPGGGQGPS